jgi:hypothetical protein
MGNKIIGSSLLKQYRWFDEVVDDKNRSEDYFILTTILLAKFDFKCAIK